MKTMENEFSTLEEQAEVLFSTWHGDVVGIDLTPSIKTAPVLTLVVAVKTVMTFAMY